MQLRTQGPTFIPTAVGQSRLLSLFRGRRDTIAYSWYCALATTSFVPHNAMEIWKEFAALTDQAIALLLTESFDSSQAQDIGVKLVDLHYIEPEALGNTQRILMHCFSTDLAPDDLVALQPRLAMLLSEVAIGFSRRVREVILEEQEAVRCALYNEHMQTEEALQVSEKHLSTIVTNAPVFLFALDREGTFTLAAGKGLEEVGITPDMWVGRSSFELSKHRPLTIQNVRRALAGEQLCVVSKLRGAVFEVRYMPHRDQNGEVCGVIGVAINVNARAQAEAALRESEARFRAIFNGAAIGIALVDMSGRIVESNHALQIMLRYSAEELRGIVFSKFMHPDDKVEDSCLYQALAQGKRDHYQLEQRYIRSDGEVLWGDVHMSLVRDVDGTPQFSVAMVEDITERRRMEVALADTQRRLAEIQEAERLHLARELHDSVVQQLFGVSYQLVEVRRRVNTIAPQEKVAPVLDMLREEVLSVVSQLRSIISDLRPAGLDDLGLTTALEGYVARLERDVGPTMPEIVLDLDRDDQEIPKSTALCLFRAIQEALRNALRHAQAHRIHIYLYLQDGVATARVRDDGSGFHVPARLSELAQCEHFGLVGITERVAYAGGCVDINSQPGMGTEVVIRVPLTEGAHSHDTVSTGVISR